MKELRVWGVKQNNLKDIEVKIPLGSMTVVCGPSGSGKSSLAFETIYAEGQRRYIESLSNYARQFLNKAPKPDIEGIENIPPAIAIEQKNYVKTSRSTVGTATEVIDYLRLLFEKIGVPYCPNCKTPIQCNSVTDATDRVLETFAGDRGYILAPVGEETRAAIGKNLLKMLIKDGFSRIWMAGKTKDIDETSALPRKSFEVVVDRAAFNVDDRGRLADSISQAYAASLRLNTRVSGGRARILTVGGKELLVSEDNACSTCGFTMPAITSRLFNFTNPVGACGTCKGFGNTLLVDEAKVVPDPTKSIAEGALEPFTMPSARADKRALLNFCKDQKIDTLTPWEKLPEKSRKVIWEESEDFFGVVGLFNYLETKKYKMHVRVFLARYKSPFLCKTCNGTRLKPEAEAVLINGQSITKTSELTLEKLYDFMSNVKLTPAQKKIAEEPLKQILSRLSFLCEVGVEYLTLDRQTRTLSGGEYQRIQLANQLGMVLSQTLYVLDEPTVGLHPRDNDRLISILKKLKDIGNTLIVVEHDPEVIRSADHIVEMGPGSGHLGGQIMYAGPTADFYNAPKTNTAPFLKKSGWLPPRTPRPVDVDSYRYMLELKGCSGNNLKKVDVRIPLRRLVAITGVSGSGKSTLIGQTLYPALARELGLEFIKGEPMKSLEGAAHVKNLVFIDQKPISQSFRSTPVTYLKIFNDIREIFASTPDSKARGYTPGTFSLNVDGGRCPVCKGEGYETVDMMFMDDVKFPCDECDSKRFRKEVLEITFQNKSIDEVLSMTTTEAMDFFVHYPGIRQSLAILQEVGLDYLRLGQPTTTLSGGESQRLKIAREFAESAQKDTLYILDEPTTGLHFREIELLMRVLNRLIDAGGSVIVIEHNMDVVSHSDWVIDLGPEGGERGGKLVFSGPPADLARTKGSYTGKYLKSHYKREAPNEASP